MAEFYCRLGTATGQIVEGVYVSESEARLRQQLEDQGLYVFAVRPRTGLGNLLGLFRVRRRLPRREFLVFNQELAALIRAGMPLVQSLDILRTRVRNPVFKGLLDDVYGRVKSGAALSEAFDAHGDLVAKVYTASLLAGEKSGSLEDVIRRYVGYVKVVSGIRRRTISALIYPAILLALSFLLINFLMIQVIPAFAEFYTGFEADLPLATKMIVRVSGAMRAHFLLALAVVVAAVLGARSWLQGGGNRVIAHGWMLRLPVIGPVAEKFATSQLARTLGTLLAGGIPLVNALEVAARSIGNRHLAREVADVADRVREGESLSAALTARNLLGPMATRMIEVGESTGALQEMLTSLADFYDEEIETEMTRLVTVVEPAILVIMGLVIASILLALYLPLFQLSQVVH